MPVPVTPLDVTGTTDRFGSRSADFRTVMVGDILSIDLGPDFDLRLNEELQALEVAEPANFLGVFDRILDKEYDLSNFTFIQSNLVRFHTFFTLIWGLDCPSTQCRGIKPTQIQVRYG